MKHIKKGGGTQSTATHDDNLAVLFHFVSCVMD
jgi:hypothetical protein